MRIYIKGGPWKNTEDEVLKAGVMKYGKNQWATIASLFSKKSASQCKARWYEWLDPSIKKTGWTREEEEKLLYLAKTLPNQWKTIAPFVGRTATQCLQHYEKLLDASQARADEYEKDKEADPRRLIKGEIDHHPESKPALPDAIDMDDDELEMLAEVRARLANTKGKKAKRKLREKQMEDVRRLAAIQKRREMRSAGIVENSYSIYNRRQRIRKKSIIKGVDYSREIPYHKKALPGFYDTTKENATIKPFEFGQTVQAIEGKRREQIEKEAKEREEKKRYLRKKNDIPYEQKKLEKMKQVIMNKKLESKLNLPTPLISDSELQNIGKMGVQAIEQEEPLSKEFATPALKPQHELQTPSHSEYIEQQAREIIERSNASTPLHGGQSRKTSTMAYTPASVQAMHTPRVPETPLNEPSRDGPNHNDTSLPYKNNFKPNQSILEQFSNRSKPSQSEYQIQPQFPENHNQDKMEDIEDQEDIQSQIEQKRELKRQEELDRRSSVIKRTLPIPQQFSWCDSTKEAIYDELMKDDEDDVRNPKDAIEKEMKQIILRDRFQQFTDRRDLPPRESIPLQYLDRAYSLIQSEYELSNPTIPLNEFHKIWTASHPVQSADKNTLFNLKKKRTKIEQKIRKYHTGYHKAHETILQQIVKLQKELDHARHCYAAIQSLSDLEHAAEKSRKNELIGFMEKLRLKNKELQALYTEQLESLEIAKQNNSLTI